MRNINLSVIFKTTTISLVAMTICFAWNVQAAEPDGSSLGTITLLESVRQNYYANERMEALKNSASPGIKRNVPADKWLKKVNINEVNMVTNRHIGEGQNAIHIDGKTYFATGNGYALNLQGNPSVRFAKDPLTNRIVDKADAAVYSDASGRILYFESDVSFERFVGLADSDTLYGYSK